MNANAFCFTTSQAARFLEVNEDTIRRWANSDKLTAQRTQNGVRIFTREELLRFAAARAVKAK